MDRSTVLEEVAWLVTHKGGLKTLDLIKELALKFARVDPIQVNDIINELVENKRIIELEYSIDFTEVQSFLLPPRTSINIRGQENTPRRI